VLWETVFGSIDAVQIGFHVQRKVICGCMLVGVSGVPYTEDIVPYDTEGFGVNVNGVKVWLVVD